MAELAEQQDAPADRPGAPRTTTRLMIREMVLENFKSYAGEQRVGPFHKVCWALGMWHPTECLKNSRAVLALVVLG